MAANRMVRFLNMLSKYEDKNSAEMNIKLCHSLDQIQLRLSPAPVKEYDYRRVNT